MSCGQCPAHSRQLQTQGQGPGLQWEAGEDNAATLHSQFRRIHKPQIPQHQDFGVRVGSGFDFPPFLQWAAGPPPVFHHRIQVTEPAMPLTTTEPVRIWNQVQDFQAVISVPDTFFFFFFWNVSAINFGGKTPNFCPRQTCRVPSVPDLFLRMLLVRPGPPDSGLFARLSCLTFCRRAAASGTAG